MTESNQPSPPATGHHLLTVDDIGVMSPATAPDLICTHDLEGRIHSVNAEACEALGLSAATLRRMKISDLLPSADSSGHTEYLRTIERDGVAHGTMSLSTAGAGRRTWEYRCTLDREASPPLVRGVARDVTERERTFHRIRSSEELFRTIIENASDLTAIVEPDGRIRYDSPSVERVLGHPWKSLLGTLFIDLVHPEDVTRAEDFMAQQVNNPGAMGTIELRARHRDGPGRSFEIVAKNLIEQGRTSAIVMTARDITERKLLETQLVQANRLAGLGRLAATVAHQFNNVLMGMQPFAELMQRPNATPPMILNGASHIANSIQRGKRAVQEILRFTQPHLPVTAVIDAGQWWDRFVPEAESILGNLFSIATTIPDGLYVIADEMQLSQVLANLVANARDAMPNGGTLSVEASGLEPHATFPFGIVADPERFVRISIRDTGHGMSAAIMERIFEPLYTTRQNGIGLGLAVAYQIMAQHEGFLFAESEPGQGSTFHLFLPRAKQAAAGTPRNEESHAPAPKRLLIIDDEEPIVEGISMLLEQIGFEVEGIGNGNEAEAAVAMFQPHVVLLDFGLPGMDGGEVYSLIRAMDFTLPIIFATGHGDRRILHDRLNDPRCRFLQKPFEVKELLEMIAALEAEDP